MFTMSITEQKTEPASRILEQCGQWLLSISREDVAVLQLAATAEFQEFISSFNQLEQAHRQVISLSPSSSSSPPSPQPPPPPPAAAASSTSEFPASVVSQNARSSYTVTPTETSNRHCLDVISLSSSSSSASSSSSYGGGGGGAGGWGCQDSFVDNFVHKFVRAEDDMLLRIFECLDSTSLIRVSRVSRRFNQLALQSAKQQTLKLTTERQLNNVMQLLRVQEQLNGLDWSGGSDTTVVPVPILLPQRRIVVSGSGDPEFDGVYYCSSSTTNGFQFTKSRYAARRLATLSGVRNNERQGHTMQQQQQQQNDDDQNEQEDAIGGNPRRDRALAQVPRIPAPPPPPLPQQNVNEHVVMVDQPNQQHELEAEAEEEPLLASENHNRRPAAHATRGPLRCIIQKKFSNQELYWYMCKEVAVNTDDGGEGSEIRHNVEREHRATGGVVVADNQTETASGQPTEAVREVFYYWAPLSFDDPTDAINYPSTSSNLAAHGSMWRTLPTTTGPNHSPPTVEMLD